jgi:hypothetical protein
MSNIKKLFTKVKRGAKFAKAGEGHRLNESSLPQSGVGQSSDGGIAGRAAAEAAQSRLQQQLSRQQSGTSSEITM